MKTHFLNHLNPQQQAAALCVDKPSLILAGAGSGKTRVLTCKVLNLITHHRVNPKNIIMITFTNKAGAELKRRLKRPLGFVGTFHSLCVRLLREDGAAMRLSSDFVIYDEADQNDIIKNCLRQKNLGEKYSPSYILNKISGAKNQLIDEKQYRQLFTDYANETIAVLYHDYQKILSQNHAVDFDDLIMKTVLLLRDKADLRAKWQKRFRYLLVDEFQDTNYAQYLLVKYLGKGSGNVTAVGDFSQSIYSWRGAEIKNLDRFQTDFPGAQTFYLKRNYRSTQKILNFAYQVISQNQTHPILQLLTDNHEGEDVVISQLDNEQYEAFYLISEIQQLRAKNNGEAASAVLYRTNAQSRIIEEAFLHAGLPYVLVGGTRFYERKEIKDVLAFSRLLINPADTISSQRVIKLGKKRYQSFLETAATLQEQKNQLTTLDMINTILEKTGYLRLFNEINPEDAARLENIKELLSVALNFPNLTQFLEQVALVESEYFEHEKKQQEPGAVSLMTLHQAKGLEFPYVFIVGAEDGLLPHSRALYDQLDLEEERRLFYVGITRAQKKLYVTHVKKRFLFGRRTYAVPSRFLMEMNNQ